MAVGDIYAPEYSQRVTEYLWSKMADVFPRGITPTDIDMFHHTGRITAMVEMSDSFLFIEGKTAGADIPKGQKLALTRLVDKLPGSLLIVLFHPPSPQINPMDDIISFWYYGNRHKTWVYPTDGGTLEDIIMRWVNQ
jgi:hypothetical protein